MIPINCELRIVTDKDQCKIFGQGETRCLSIRVVSNRKVKDEYVADFLTVKLWTKEYDSIRFMKGDSIAIINGSLEIDKYKNKDGNEVENIVIKCFNAFFKSKIPTNQGGSRDWGNTPANDSPFDDSPVSEGGW